MRFQFFHDENCIIGIGEVRALGWREVESLQLTCAQCRSHKSPSRVGVSHFLTCLLCYLAFTSVMCDSPSRLSTELGAKPHSGHACNFLLHPPSPRSLSRSLRAHGSRKVTNCDGALGFFFAFLFFIVKGHLRPFSFSLTHSLELESRLG